MILLHLLNGLLHLCQRLAAGDLNDQSQVTFFHICSGMIGRRRGSREDMGSRRRADNGGIPVTDSQLANGTITT